MKEETYAFIEDIKERKSQARSAANKKNGSKSKKCTLPSDYLSKKEREKMNGEVKTWNMNTFYTWDEFKKMPDDLKSAYISTISQKYQVGMVVISQYQFNLAKNYLCIYMHRKQLVKELKLFKGKAAKDNINEYLAAISKAHHVNLLTDEEEHKDDAQVVPSHKKTKISSMAFTMNRFDVDIFNQIAKLFDEDNVTINIEVFRRV